MIVPCTGGSAREPGPEGLRPSRSLEAMEAMGAPSRSAVVDVWESNGWFTGNARAARATEERGVWSVRKAWGMWIGWKDRVWVEEAAGVVERVEAGLGLTGKLGWTDSEG